MAFLVYTALRMLTSGSWTLTVTWLRDGAPYSLRSARAGVGGRCKEGHSGEFEADHAMDMGSADLPSWLGVRRRSTQRVQRLCAAATTSGRRHLLRETGHRLSGSGRDGWPPAPALGSGPTPRDGRFSVCSLSPMAPRNSPAEPVSSPLSSHRRVARLRVRRRVGRAPLRRLTLLALVPAAALTAAALLPSTTVGARLIATVQSWRHDAASPHRTQKARRTRGADVVRCRSTGRQANSRGRCSAPVWASTSWRSRDFQVPGRHRLQRRSKSPRLLHRQLRSAGPGRAGPDRRPSLVNLAVRMLTFRRRIAEDELLTFAALLIIAFISVASLGVVLEAPFGAVPFWWAAGLILALAPDRPSLRRSGRRVTRRKTAP